MATAETTSTSQEIRYVEVTVKARDGGLHPIDRRLATHEGITKELMHNVKLLDDGTGIVVYQLRGDDDDVRDAIDCPETLGYHITQTGELTITFIHFEPNAKVTGLLTIFDVLKVGLDMPLEFTRNGTLTAHVYGDEAVIREALQSVPDDVNASIRRVGDYQPESERLYGMLTERQRETLLAAIETGYYNVPREATHEDIADYLDRSPGTIGEHLRKIESKLMAAIAP